MGLCVKVSSFLRIQYNVHEMIVSAQTLMSVQAMMVDVIRCVPTLKGALCVLVILDTN